jgi:hypothetical protein
VNPSVSESKTIPCDVVLLPSESQSRLAVQVSQLLSPQGSLFTLDDRNFYAHASLYMFQLDVENQAACIAALRQIAEQTNVQRLVRDGYFYQDQGFARGYTDVAFARNGAVDALQMRVVDVFAGLRAGMRESDKQKMTDATGVKLENLQKYGYPAIGELFRPHITLTKFPVEIEPDLTMLPPVADFTGEFTRLGLFEMGSNGTCIRKIAEFVLTK